MKPVGLASAAQASTIRSDHLSILDDSI